MDNEINVLSLFDGMSCGQIALNNLGININKYYAAEIDPHAIKVTKHNFPNTIHLGDVTKVKAKDLDCKIDLLIGGSPCQGFSFAGKQLNFNDPRSALFFEFVRLWKEIKEINPNAKFMLENVNMKREYLRVISEHLQVFPVNINSNLVSAQNRNRWYWSNIKTKDVGLFSELWTDFPQPKDKGILLKDILQPESEVDDKYYLSAEAISSIFFNPNNLQKSNINPDKSNPLQSPGNSCGIYKGMSAVVTKNYIQWDSTGNNHKSQYDRAYLKDGQVGALLASDSQGKFILEVSEATTKGYTEIKPGECVDLENPKSKTRRGRKLENKSNCLMATTTQQFKYTEDMRLRRLTPIECERLQTVPDNYTACVSDSQRYKMLGNGWTVKVIEHMFKYLEL